MFLLKFLVDFYPILEGGPWDFLMIYSFSKLLISKAVHMVKKGTYFLGIYAGLKNVYCIILWLLDRLEVGGTVEV